MKFQSNRASCGPASLSNALACLGIHRTEDELITLCAQTPAGTSVRALCKAIKQISTTEIPLFGEAVKWGKESDATIGLWHYASYRGRPVILCVDDFEHWVVAAGHLGERFVVIDSADNRLVLYYDAPGLVARWEGPKGGYHGIIV